MNASGIDLRSRAEAMAQSRAEGSPEAQNHDSLAASQKLLHELQVHQIELELQNEELRRVQGELEGLKERYFEFYNLAPVVFFTLSESGLIQEANFTAVALLGTTAQALDQRPFSRFIHAQDTGQFNLRTRHLLDTGEPQEFDLRLVKADGTTFWGHLVATLLREAGIIRLVISDVTERRGAEDALRASNELLSRFIENSPIYAFIKQVDSVSCRVLYASENFQQMIGIPGSKMVGKSMEELFPAELAAKIDADDRAVVLSGKLLEIDEELHDRHYRTLKFPISLGETTLLAGYTIDVTEHHLAEARRLQLEANSQQIRKAESLGVMAGAVAHIFNNKLQSVIGNLEIINLLEKDDDPGKYTARAKQSAEQAADISKDLLIYLGNTRPELEPRLLAMLCNRHVPHLQKTMPATINLEADCPYPGPVVNANKEQIHQVITNLVTNAAESMAGKTGCVHLRIYACSPADIRLTHWFPLEWQPHGQDYACLEVTDEGIGMPDSVLDKLFDPFYTTKFIGRGMGLPTVLGIVQTHGGGLTVESREGQSSTFRAYFPVSELEPLPSDFELDDAAPTLKVGGTILLIDDVEALLLSTKTLIEKMGFTAITARNGLEGLEVFQQYQEEIRCVITDLTMPRMDGWETIYSLRQMKPDLPMILTSGYDKTEVLSGKHSDRPQLFLGKPYDFEQLRKTVGQALQDG